MCTFYMHVVFVVLAHLCWLGYNVWTDSDGLSFTWTGMGLFFGSVFLWIILLTIDYNSCRAIQYNLAENGAEFFIEQEIQRIQEARM